MLRQPIVLPSQAQKPVVIALYAVAQRTQNTKKRQLAVICADANVVVVFITCDRDALHLLPCHLFSRPLSLSVKWKVPVSMRWISLPILFLFGLEQMLPCRCGVHGGPTLTSSPSPRYSLGWNVWYVSYILPRSKMIHDLVFLSLHYVRTALILYLSRSSPAHNMPSAWCHRRLLSASTILFASRSALTTAPAMLPRCSGSVCSPAKSSLPSYSGFDSSRKSALERP